MTETPGATRPVDPRDRETVPVPGMLAEVREGLTSDPRTLPSKYFYDHDGSELFEEITRLPEYYLTRAEIELLQGVVKEWIRSLDPRTLVELGAGSGRKTRILLEALTGGGRPTTYVPVDVSGDFLEASAKRLRREHEGVDVRPVVADITGPLDAVGAVPGPAVFALLGSTIGNFAAAEASALLGRIRGLMGPGDAFLMGADLRPRGSKPREVLEAAYNDAAGVTAEFNRNVLRVLNRELGTDFEPDAFRHRAFYADEEDRIEMHLVAGADQQVHLPDGTVVAIEEGESIRTEISCKYDRESVAAMFDEAGLELEAWHLEGAGRYAVAVGRPGPKPIEGGA